MAKKILVVTSAEEPNVARVLRFLDPASVFRLNTDQLLQNSFVFRARGTNVDWEVITDQSRIKSEEICSVWYRRPSAPIPGQEVRENYREFVKTESQKFLHVLWSTMSRSKIFWMNHPEDLHRLEFNKPFQTQVAERVGLLTPETLITNDPGVAREFFDKWHGQVAVKIFGGTPVWDDDKNLMSTFTNLVSRADLDAFSEDIRLAPVMLQNYIPKQIELRVTAVGERLFACAIHSQDSERTRVDWRRYDFDRVLHEPYDLPIEVSNKLRRFLRELNLSFGAIDMILTPEGEHVFLEVNPSGQWGWIESLAKLPISQAIAETLAASMV